MAERCCETEEKKKKQKKGWTGALKAVDPRITAGICLQTWKTMKQETFANIVAFERKQSARDLFMFIQAHSYTSTDQTGDPASFYETPSLLA